MKRILVIGGGSIGERHARCFQQTGRADVSLCEVHDEVRNRVTDTYSLVGSFHSLEDALKKPFDAAVICTPAHLHIEMAQVCGERDIAVLIEKPLSISPDGVNSLLTTIQAKELPAAVAYVLRSHPVLSAMRDAIHSGRFGPIIEVVMASGQHFPFYRPAYRETYYTQHQTGGGAIQDALTHMLNAAEWIGGPITRVCCDAAHQLLDGVDVEDTVHVLARHEGILGSYALNQHQPANETTLTVICERGMARYEGHHSRWLSCTQPGTEWAVELETELERDDLFIRQANRFLDLLDAEEDPACTISEGLQTLKVNLAALQSWREGRWIDV